MKESYFVPADKARAEIVVQKSRFIASATAVFSVDEARAFLNSIRAEFPNATHHVSAFIIGHGDSMIAHCSDAGEPSGTAGRPVLMVLQRSGLGDVAVVVTRYFGGVKLGTGGLARAYSDATKAVLAVLPRAHKCQVYTAIVVLPYALFERVRLIVPKYHGKILEEVFTSDVKITVRFRVEDFDSFRKALREVSYGKITQIEVVEVGEMLFPIE